MTRIHGDFHLGQVLVASGDAYIIDFEGEPATSIAERRAKTSPLRDVAGLLRSIDYAGAALIDRNDVGAVPIDEDARDRAHRPISRARFASFSARLLGSESVCARHGRSARLLDLFLIEKAAYEIAYEAANRPTWLGVPLAGLSALAVANCSTRSTEAAMAERRLKTSWRLDLRIPRARLRRPHHGDPFAVLGPHDTRRRPHHSRVPAGSTSRSRSCAEPTAASWRRLSRGEKMVCSKTCSPSERRIACASFGRMRVQETEDPYSFGLLLGDLDLHLFNEGRHFELAQCLGAQTHDGRWRQRRPLCGLGAERNARRVVGDFNSWDRRRHPMRVRHRAGIWELFMPRVAPGSRYKYDIRRSGRHRNCRGKPIPSPARPNRRPAPHRSSPHPDRHRWHDDAWMADARPTAGARCADLHL